MNTDQPAKLTTNFRIARPEIVEMRNQISNMGFFMMGATQLSFDNDNYLLFWLMGSGAKCEAVRMYYKPGLDLYTLEFLKSLTDSAKVQRVEQVYIEDVIRIIEQHTGFYLRF